MLDVHPSAAEDGRTFDDLVIAVGRDGDRAAFASLFAYFAPRLKSYLMRLGSDPGAAEELVQDVMLMVWRRAETFDPAMAGASTWIFTIARNKRVDRLRRERHPELDPDDPVLVPEPAVPADQSMESVETTRRLKAAIDSLPAGQAQLVRLAYFDDKPHSAISAEAGIPLGTVKSRLRLALERLRKTLRDDV